jgi:hypothetical protein
MSISPVANVMLNEGQPTRKASPRALRLCSILSTPTLRMLRLSRHRLTDLQDTLRTTIARRLDVHRLPAVADLIAAANETLQQRLDMQRRLPVCRVGPTLQDMIRMRDQKVLPQGSQVPGRETECDPHRSSGRNQDTETNEEKQGDRGGKAV